MIAALQALALVLTVLTMIWISWRRSLGRWMRARAEAEALRADVFRVILQAGDADAKLPAALACFRDAHLNWQLATTRSAVASTAKPQARPPPIRCLPIS